MTEMFLPFPQVSTFFPAQKYISTQTNDNDKDDHDHVHDNYHDDDVAVEIQQTGVVPPFSCCQLRLPRAGIDNDNTPGSTMMIIMMMICIMGIKDITDGQV